MTSEILNIIDTFCPIGLNDMDNVRLMNRIDTKYVMSVHKIPQFLEMMNESYKVLEISGERLFSYNSIYLDTCNYTFFRRHVRGMPGRSKVRYRTYLNTGITFLEVKVKTTKNRTIKWRIENCLAKDGKCDDTAMEFLSRHFQGEDLYLRPVIRNEFRRITFISRRLDERITLDFNLAFRCNGSSSLNLPELAIIELKKDSNSIKSAATGILKDISVYPTGFSKYCIGISYLCNVPHKNLVKPKLLLIKKVRNEYINSIGA